MDEADEEKVRLEFNSVNGCINTRNIDSTQQSKSNPFQLSLPKIIEPEKNFDTARKSQRLVNMRNNALQDMINETA